MRWRIARAATVACALVGCARTQTGTRPERADPTQADWSRARERLAWMRSTESARPYVVLLRVAMHEPWTGRSFSARGVLAVQPHTAARMILVGPGGGTALDMWLTPTRWRFVVPAADLRRAGGVDPAEERGLPVGFFRWWFLSPLDGRLLTATVGAEDTYTFVLRDREGGTISLEEKQLGERERVFARRRDAGDLEFLGWLGRGMTPHPADRVRYVQHTTGLEVDVDVEAVSPEEPDPAAFLDPDDPGVAL
jgi:hypothetical protein